MKPQGKLTNVVMHNDLPVDPLDIVVKYCEKYIDAFEYPLAYLKAKFHVKTNARIDTRILKEAALVAT